MVKTWEFLFLIFTVCFIGSAMAQQFTTTTGQGYFTWNGEVMSYYHFIPNSTFALVNGVTATDTMETPTQPINAIAFNAYLCNQNNNAAGC